MVRADLHTHLSTLSPGRRGRRYDFNKVIDVASKKLGYGGVLGMVSFSSDYRYEHFVEEPGYDLEGLEGGFYVDEKNLLVVRGQEVTVKAGDSNGHLLILGTPKGRYVKEGRRIEEAIQEAKDQGGIVIADHPFYNLGVGPHLEEHPNLLNEIDGIEVFNGSAVWIPTQTPRYANQRAQDFYHRVWGQFTHLIPLASSDSHSLHAIGSSHMDIPRFFVEGSGPLVPSLKRSLNECFGDKRSLSRVSALWHAGLTQTAVVLENKIGIRV